ncbi:MAG: VOC family protein [Terriglobales bacterium]
MSAELHLNQIGQIAINAHDLDRAVAFYRDQLGMRYLFTAGDLAFFDCGGIRLMLALPDKPEFDHPSSILYFKVADIQKAHEDLAARQVRMDAPPRLIAKLEKVDVWLSSFYDSENNLLALMSEVPR